MSAAFERVLLKLSGEALMGDLAYGADPDRIAAIAAEIKEEQKKLHARRERESPRALSFAVWSSTSTRSAPSECVLAYPPPLLHARTPQ